MGAVCSQLDNIEQGDIIIPILGLPGAGKSTFINVAVGREVVPINHVSGSGPTRSALYVKCSSPENDGRNIVFVEITLSELDLSGGGMTEELNYWLTVLSVQGLEIPGILYLHRIVDNEPISLVLNHLTSLRSQKEFSRLLSATQVVIVTTIWGALQSPSISVGREKELEEYVAGLEAPRRNCVSQISHFSNTFESAWSIISACIQVPEGPQLHPDHDVEPGSFSAARILISRVIRNTRQKARVAELVGEDAQCMADFLNIVLHENGILSTDEGKSLLDLLRNLSKSAQVFPQCYELKGVRCDFSRPRNGGGFADIFKGEHRNQAICIKAARIFREQDNTQMLRAHVKELILWAHLSHKNILPFYGAFLFDKEPQRLCIVSPWIHNGDLPTFLENFPQTPRIPLVSDVTAGLLYLHGYGIAHGDLKAKNVLVSDDGRALIADFGISCIIMNTKLNSTRLSNGTMHWTAPELLNSDTDNPPPTPESDIWSFSCLCYEILTCKTPFYQYNTHRLMLALMREVAPAQPTTEDGIDECMWDLMNRCWSYAPSKRPTCKEIQQVVMGIGIPDDRPRTSLQASGPSAFWEDIRKKSDIMIDYERVHRALLRIHQNQPGTHVVSSSTRQDLFITTGILNGPAYGSPSPYTVQSPIENHKAVRKFPKRTEPQIDAIPVRTPTLHPSKAISVSPEKLRSDDIVIAVMGPTGTGKSNFIEVLTGQSRTRSSLESYTNQIQSTAVENYMDDRRLVLVDIPGFDDTYKSDMEILGTISKWLEKTYRRNVKLTGILYLHRITDNRMGGSPLKNLRIFGELCGDVAMRRVTLVTTMWDKMRDLELGQQREKELRDTFWKGMLNKGSTIAKFDNKFDTAKAIVHGLIVEKEKREALLLQEELVDVKKRLNETHAGRMLYDNLQRLLDEQKASIEKLIAQIDRQDIQNNRNLLERLTKEQKRIEDDLERTLDGIRKLKVPLSRRIVLFFFGKKGKIKALSSASEPAPGVERP